MTPHALLFTLAAIGISEASYLIKKRRNHEHPTCIIGGQCQLVLESKYNKMFGVNNDTKGFLFFVAIAVIMALLVIGVEPLELWERIAEVLIGLGTLMSLFLMYLQWKVIKAWCFWCIMSNCTVFLMALIVLLSDLTNL